MIKHIVCFKLKNPTVEVVENAKNTLLSMQGKVPQIKGLFVGTDVLHSERSYDVILEVVVENMAQLDAYQNDAYHCTVVKALMHTIQQSSVALDCEI